MTIIKIITPVFNEQASLETFYQNVSRLLISRTDTEYHVVFVDDGSTDDSWPIICGICEKSERFSALRLSRNYGSHAAIAAGFDHADGDAVATLACDLQDPPDVILEFVERWEKGAQIVWGHRRTRDDDNWKRLASRVLSYLIKRFAMPKNSKVTTGSFLLIDKIVLQAVNQLREVNRITFALVGWTGFEQDIVYYDRQSRIAGASGWTFNRMISTMLDALIGFSELPARIITATGVVMWLFSIILGIFLLFSYVAGDVLPGWTSTMLLFTIFSGILFLMLGIIGEYLHRIYDEVTQRPIYIVSDARGPIVVADTKNTTYVNGAIKTNGE